MAASDGLWRRAVVPLVGAAATAVVTYFCVEVKGTAVVPSDRRWKSVPIAATITGTLVAQMHCDPPGTSELAQILMLVPSTALCFVGFFTGMFAVPLNSVRPKPGAPRP